MSSEEKRIKRSLCCYCDQSDAIETCHSCTVSSAPWCGLRAAKSVRFHIPMTRQMNVRLAVLSQMSSISCTDSFSRCPYQTRTRKCSHCSFDVKLIKMESGKVMSSTPPAVCQQRPAHPPRPRPRPRPARLPQSGWPPRPAASRGGWEGAGIGLPRTATIARGRRPAVPLGREGKSDDHSSLLGES